MAAILNPAPANSPELSSPSFARLVAGLAALVIGVAALLGSAVQPDVESHPAVAPAQAAIRTSGAPSAAGHDTARTAQRPGRLIPGVDRPRPDRRSTGPTIPNRIGAELNTALADGTRAEFAHLAELAHLATVPLQPDGWDTRWGLIEMAAAQRRDWTRHCPCPIYLVRDARGGPR